MSSMKTTVRVEGGAMRYWNLAQIQDSASGRETGLRQHLHTVAEMVAGIGGAEFGKAALAAFNLTMPAASWSVYRLYRDRPPRLHVSGAYRALDITQDCFAAYADGLYQQDASLGVMHGMAIPGDAVLSHIHAHDLPRAHSDRIYRRHGMRERVSVVNVEQDNELLAINFYRHAGQSGFSEREIDILGGLVPVVRACLTRHLALEAPAGLPSMDAMRQRLARYCPTLSPRERDVCVRLALGWTYDGIAADLSLSVSTTKTYRNRAFARMGIRYRQELLSRLM
ncbi:helix-turn-helix transcriptional regulator [Kerstersia sp.]|uniref:helix-turn-helix transcriptional regulator n=1 Tax=Kerstersia sp. TaxID=1930783 RepID=UPI003F8E5792